MAARDQAWRIPALLGFRAVPPLAGSGEVVSSPGMGDAKGREAGAPEAR